MTYQKNSKVGEVVTTTHDLPSVVLHPHHTRTSLCGPPPKTLIQRKVPIRALHMDSRKKLLAVGKRREEEGGGRKREEEGGGRRREEGEGGGRRREEEGGGRRGLRVHGTVITLVPGSSQLSITLQVTES